MELLSIITKPPILRLRITDCRALGGPLWKSVGCVLFGFGRRPRCEAKQERLKHTQFAFFLSSRIGRTVVSRDKDPLYNKSPPSI